MVDDIVEAVIDLLGDLLEIAISSKRGKRKRSERKKAKTVQQCEPWERSDQAVPWEK